MSARSKASRTVMNSVNWGKLGGWSAGRAARPRTAMDVVDWNRLNGWSRANANRRILNPVRATPPPKSRMGLGRSGKIAAAGVVGAGVLYSGARNRSGRPVDPMSGTPRGMYGY